MRDTEVTLTGSALLSGAVALQALVVVLVVVGQYGPSVPLVRPVVGVLALAFVPGLVVVVGFGMDDRPVATLSGYVVGFSMVLVMVAGAAASLALPLAGVDRPLAPVPLVALLGGLVAVLAAAAWRRGAAFELTVPVGWLLAPVPLALLLLPFWSVFGTVLLDVRGDNRALLALLVVLAALPVVVAVRRRDARWHPLGVWTVALALLYHGGLWPFVGGHQASVTTLELGRWVPDVGTGQAVLPNGVLFPVYATVTGLPLPVEVGVVNPLLVSFLPVVLYEILRRRIDSPIAFVTTCFFMFSFPFYTLYPRAGRVATPVFFLALLGLVLSDEAFAAHERSAFALTFAVGLGVSHYGTAYVAMFALVAALVIVLAFRIADARKRGRDRPVARGVRNVWLDTDDRPTMLSPSFVGFYAVFTVAWYLHTARGAKFRLLPRKVLAAVEGVMYTRVTGSAARTVTKQYGSTSIAVSRELYLLFGALMALGIAAALVGRFVYWERTEDEYLAIATGLIIMLGGSFLPSGTGFNVARVMMIVFTFAAPFALVGLVVAFEAVRGALARLSLGVGASDDRPTRGLLSAFAVVLAAFLLLNSGVASELAFGDYGPSTKVSNERLLRSEEPIERTRATECVECNVEIHAWILTHAGPGTHAYGDFLAWSQIDFFRGAITDRTGSVPGKPFYGPMWKARDGTAHPAYHVVLPHNEDTGGVLVGSKYDWQPYGGLERVFDRSNRIYDSGESTVYMTTARSNGTDERG